MPEPLSVHSRHRRPRSSLLLLSLPTNLFVVAIAACEPLCRCCRHPSPRGDPQSLCFYRRCSLLLSSLLASFCCCCRHLHPRPSIISQFLLLFSPPAPEAKHYQLLPSPPEPERRSLLLLLSLAPEAEPEPCIITLPPEPEQRSLLLPSLPVLVAAGPAQQPHRPQPVTNLESVSLNVVSPSLSGFTLPPASPLSFALHGSTQCPPRLCPMPCPLLPSARCPW